MTALARAAHASFFVAALLAIAPSAAQTFPSKPIRILTQFGPGTSGDLTARALAKELTAVMGQPVLVENRPGGGGILAASLVARAAPDGHTIMSATTTVPVMYAVAAPSSLPFDPERDFSPILQMVESPILLVANPSFPPGTLREAIEYAKGHPGKISYGTTGIGSAFHLAGEYIRLLTGAEMVHVPYKTNPVLDAVSGVIPMAYVAGSQGMPLVTSKKVKVLAVLNSARFRQLPETPTIAEVVPGFETPPTWTGLFGPANLPTQVLRRLHADVVRVLTSPEVAAFMHDRGYEMTLSKSPEEFAQTVKRQIELVRKIVKAANIKLE